MVAKRREAAGAAKAAARFQAWVLARRDRVEGGGYREAEPTRTSLAAGSAHQQSRDPGSFACSCLLLSPLLLRTGKNLLEAWLFVPLPASVRTLIVLILNQFSGWINRLHGALEEAGDIRP